MQALGKLTEVVDGETRFVSDPPLLVPIEELVSETEGALLTERMHELLRSYRHTLQSDRRHLLNQFRFVSIARKVVGVGSVGTRAWVILMVGSDGEDPLLLQAKEAQASVLAEFVGESRYTNQGERVVAGQHLMQASSDIFLGWDQVEGIDGVQRDFYIRQLRDWKGSADTDQMTPRPWRSTDGCADGLWRGPMPGRATASPSPPTWGRESPSTTPSPRSPSPMPTRTSATTRPSGRRRANGRIVVQSGL